METRVVIVGGGLCGLTMAMELAKLGIDFQLVEARPRFGGRILTLDSVVPGTRFDLGPSWFWPGQTNIERLIEELNLEPYVFEQASMGDSVYEQYGGAVQRGVSGISMAGSLRLKGGMTTLINAVTDRIADLGCADRLQLSSGVSSVELLKDGIKVKYQHGEFYSKKTVLALPARVALKTIEFSPSLEPDRISEIQGVATWMAGHSKVVVEYQTQFWKDLGYSGDVISQIGPMSEIHDASSNSDFGLFGFLGFDPAMRIKHHHQLPELILQQLSRIFGSKANTPLNIHIQDWAQEPFTSVDLDQHIPSHHPLNTWSTTIEPSWNGNLLWSGTETAGGNINGYLEGAVVASMQSLQQLVDGEQKRVNS